MVAAAAVVKEEEKVEETKVEETKDEEQPASPASAKAVEETKV